MSSSLRSRSLIALGLLVGLIVWLWRPAPAVGAVDPYFAPELPNRAHAARVADSLFQLTGVTIDSMFVLTPNTLMVLLPKGALVKPTYLRDDTCVSSWPAFPAITRLALLLDELYGEAHQFAGIQVHTKLQRLKTRDGQCGSQASVSLSRHQLDSLRRSAK